jgi:hypothetical protein
LHVALHSQSTVVRTDYQKLRNYADLDISTALGSK